jgi:PAS domain S-box-containing protein
MAGICMDITERKRTEQALVESERTFAEMFRASPTAMMAAEASEDKLIIRDVNEAFEGLFGYRRDELIGRPTLDFPLWVDDAARLEMLGRFRAEGRIHPIEFEFRTKAGGRGTGLFSAVAARIGGRRDLIASYVDISERKRAEQAERAASEAIAEAARHYHLLFNSGSDAILVHRLGADGRPGELLEVNDNACRYLGYSREELLGMKTADIDAPGSAVNAPAIGRQLLERGELVWEGVHRAKDGRRIPVEMHARVLESSAAPLIISHVRDIGARKAAEQAYREIFEGAQEGIWRTTFDGRLLSANPALARSLGYGTAAELVAAVSDAANQVWVDPEGRAEMVRRVREQGAVDGVETQMRRRDGTLTWARISAWLVRSADGTPHCLQGFGVDISDRKRAEQRTAKLEERLRQAQKLEGIGRLAGGVAHEFNNLLTVINGYGRLLAQSISPSDPLHAYAKAIVSSGDRAAKLTSELLAFGRKQMIHPRPVDLNAAVCAFAEMFRALLGERIALVMNLDEALGTVLVDPDQLHQVVMNLVVNARDALPGQGRIEIATENVEFDEESARGLDPEAAPGRYVLMRVSDNGRGMEESVRQRVFEPFFSTKPAATGRGLGLATVYGAAHQSGGWITVESEAGAGSTFKLYLPRMDAPWREAAGGSGERAQGGSEAILVVEDQENVLFFAGAVLTQYGYRVVPATSAEEALALLDRNPDEIQLLLADVVLPGMNGPELANGLKRLYPRLKVAYISGYAADEIARHGALGPDEAFLRKPFTPDELAAMVREVLDRRTGEP